MNSHRGASLLHKRMRHFGTSRTAHLRPYTVDADIAYVVLGVLQDMGSEYDTGRKRPVMYLMRAGLGSRQEGRFLWPR
jgi:hypothetical protein